VTRKYRTFVAQKIKNIMEKMHFKVLINAPRERVWETLWGDDTYPAWTAPFVEGMGEASAEGSKAITDWKEGSKVLFLGGSGEGMVSRIDRLVPNEFMGFKHLGTVKNGVEDTDSEEAKNWSGAMEEYTLKTVGNQTELTVDMDMTDDFKDYFNNTWPKALARLKEIAEQ
jgi:hypothetical protein